LVALAFAVVAVVSAAQSRQSALVAVPDLLGMPSDEAEQLVHERGLQIAVHGSSHSMTEPAGVIIGQAPGPGERISNGEIVGVELSLGEERVVVPELLGRPGAEVRQLLRDAGLVLGTTRSIASAQVAVGHVAGQDPAPGAEVARDAPVAVSLSVGPPQSQAAPRPANAEAPVQIRPAPPAVVRPQVQQAQPGRGNNRRDDDDDRRNPNRSNRGWDRD
jgi:serine/threonine-protein kinase